MDSTGKDQYLAIDRYIKGRMTDSEEAEFQKLLVRDSDLVKEVNFAIDRYLAIDRYVQDRLIYDEEEEFDDRLVWDRDLLKEVALAEKLEEGLRFVAGASRGLFWLREVLTMPRYAAAASFVAGALLTSMILGQVGMRPEPVAADAAQTHLAPLLVLRTADPQTIRAPEDGLTVLMVDVPRADTSYRVTVRRAGAEETFWAQDGLLPGYLQALAVAIPGESLTPGRYLLIVEESADLPTSFRQEIPFRVARDE